MNGKKTRAPRTGRFMAPAFFCLCLISIGLFPLRAEAMQLRIIDGDTLELNGEKIRLDGIDAPESAQTCVSSSGEAYPCGKEATAALKQLTLKHQISCVGVETDVYDRRIATCYADGRNINADMVREGQALAFRRYSERYVKDESDARAAKRGLWSGIFDAPWSYRKGSRKAESYLTARLGTTSPSNSAGHPRCPIKGNISANGRIYHLPGSRDYARTQINEARGERWFCSEIEAIVAGWRKAR